MIIDFNRYNGGGGSGSGSTDLTNYWNSAQTESAITVAVEPKADKKILVDFDRTPQADRATLYATLKALYDGGSGATINKDYDFFKTVGPKQGLKIDYYTFSGGTAVFGKVVSPDNISDQVVYGQVLTIDSAGTVNVVTNTVGGGSASGIGDSTVLKATADYPEDPELGDIITKINTDMPTFWWNDGDNTTAKMHIDLDVLDTGETYQVMSFQSEEYGQLNGILEYDSENEYWVWRFYDGNDDVAEAFNLDEDENLNIPVGGGFYAGLGYLDDDYSGAGGMMLQIGRTGGDFGDWQGNVNEIPGIATTDINIDGVPGVPSYDGPLYYDGNDWMTLSEYINGGLYNELDNDVYPRFNGLFPRMPYFNLDGGGVGIDQVKSAIFDTFVPDGDEEPVNCSGIWLLNTAFDWLDNNVWDWVDGQINFIIDPEEKVAYIENIPAGNYIFGLNKSQAGDNYDEFDINYWSKDSNNWEGYTVENSTDDIWGNSDLAIDEYWRYKFENNVVLTNNGEWFNWSFPKDVERFEIRIVDDGEGNESLEINTTYASSSADLSNYWTSAQTQDAISAATSGKADAATSITTYGSITGNLVRYNSQGIITGSSELWGMKITINGKSANTATNTSIIGSNLANIYAPTTPGTAGDILVSTGGTPVWSAVTMPDMSEYYTSAQTEDAISAATLEMVTSTDVRHIVKLTQAAYDQLVLDDEVDPYTFYIIVSQSS